MQGRIRAFNPVKNWGFIDAKDEFPADIFLHGMHIKDWGNLKGRYVGHQQAKSGEGCDFSAGPLVEFDLDLNERKPAARNLIIIEKDWASDAPAPRVNVRQRDDDQDPNARGKRPKGVGQSQACPECRSSVAVWLGVNECFVCRTPAR